MISCGYDSYQTYREETSVRTPRTEKLHKAKLNKKLSELYDQRDFRALELISELVDILVQNEEPERAKDIYFTASRLLEADERLLKLCIALLK